VREEVRIELLSMSWSTAEVEVELSKAATASLKIAAESRPYFIALRLLGETFTPSEDEILKEAPEDIDGEIDILSEKLQDAVNAAARHVHDGAGLPRAIAAYLIQHEGMEIPDVERTDDYFADDEDAAAGRLQGESGGDSGAGGTSALAPPQQTASSGASSVVAALAGRGKFPQSRTGAHALLRRVSSSRVAGDASKASRETTTSRTPQRRRRNLPVLGKKAEEVLPAVIGTFQEYGAVRAMRETDDKIVAQAIEAGTTRQNTMEDPSEVSNDEKALRALGLGGGLGEDEGGAHGRLRGGT
jgi:hypothetical protein